MQRTISLVAVLILAVLVGMVLAASLNGHDTWGSRAVGVLLGVVVTVVVAARRRRELPHP